MRLMLKEELVNSTSATSQAASLPDITGWVSVNNNYSTKYGYVGYYSGGGAFYKGGTATSRVACTSSATNTSISDIYFQASHSSSVYGDSSTVTPLSRKCLFYIKY